MAKGPHVPRQVRDEISALAQNPNLNHWEIRLRVLDVFAGTGFYVPGPDSVRKTVKQVRDYMRGHDAPWSIGASTFEIPPDALPEVLQVWKLCVVQGITLTIRQVRWIVRLRAVELPDWNVGFLPGRPWKLLHWASLYAGREISAGALGWGLDTGSLDARLVFAEEEYKALVNVGWVDPLTYGEELETSAIGNPDLAELVYRKPFKSETMEALKERMVAILAAKAPLVSSVPP